MNPGTLAPFVEGWRARRRERARLEAELRERLRARLPAVANTLVRDFGARRIVLFGSLVRDVANASSDVDLLVEGLRPEHIIEASVAVDRILVEARSDLVPVSLARKEILAQAEAEGEVLFG